jgi:hypothetical protein
MTNAITTSLHEGIIPFETLLNNYRNDITISLGYDLDAPPVLIDDKQAAQVLGVSPNTLAIWRSLGRYRIPFIKSGRLVRYRVDDLATFLARRTVIQTGKIA